MSDKELYYFKSISEYHRALDVPKPAHPLISLIDYGEVKRPMTGSPVNLMADLYCISIKKNFEHKFSPLEFRASFK